MDESVFMGCAALINAMSKIPSSGVASETPVIFPA